MKNKFLKVLGVGALCVTGALAFAGCSTDVSVNSEQMEMIKQLKNTYERQVELLQEQNEIMKAGSITKEDAENMLKLASQRFLSGDESIYNNFYLTVKVKNAKYKYQDEGEFKFLTLANGNKVCFRKENNYKTYMYLNAEYSTCQKIEEGNGVRGEKQDIDYAEELYRFKENAYQYFIYNNEAFDSFNLIEFNILENGNYELICGAKRDDETAKRDALVKYEITKDGYFVKIVNSEFECREFESTYEYESSTITAEFNYNTLTETDTDIARTIALLG